MDTRVEKLKSADGVEYELTVFEDIIELTDDQIEAIKRDVASKQSTQVESDRGIELSLLHRHDQNTKILEAIQKILGDSSIEEIVDSGVIDTTTHADVDRLSDTEILIKRNWALEDVEYEIAECLKNSYRAERVRIRFNPHTKKSWKHFTFTIWGRKGNDDHGKLVIYFEEDPIDHEKTIMVVTILEPTW
jgi:hypothetical protein